MSRSFVRSCDAGTVDAYVKWYRLDFVTFNSNVGLFSYARFTAELSSTGRSWPMAIAHVRCRGGAGSASCLPWCLHSGSSCTLTGAGGWQVGLQVQPYQHRCGALPTGLAGICASRSRAGADGPGRRTARPARAQGGDPQHALRPLQHRIGPPPRALALVAAAASQPWHAAGLSHLFIISVSEIRPP